MDSAARTAGATAAVLLCLGLAGPSLPAPAAEKEPTLAVAVAANFRDCLQALGEAFTLETGVGIAASSGSTGQLFAQIANGAPFDLFFSADADSPQRLQDLELIVPGSRFAYAVGKLVLITANPRFSSAADPCSLLTHGDFKTLAAANPELAPYGRAAAQALQSLGLWPQVRDRLVLGQSVGQVWQFTASGNADLGLLSLAQALTPAGSELRHWLLPESLYRPIVQQAVLLRASTRQADAAAFLEFVRGERGRRIIRDFGYGDAGDGAPAPTPADRDAGDVQP